MMKPIELNYKSASTNPSVIGIKGNKVINTFTSYNFDRSILTPASAFRFTAPGVDKEIRKSIRSGDIVSLYGFDDKDVRQQLATGFIDETDTHVTPMSVEYVLTGRDTMGALIDNDSVDDKNKIINTEKIPLEVIVKYLLKNTRMPQEFIRQQLPNGSFLFQTNPGETKASALQRYLEFTNCLMWSHPDGRMIIGKPDFAQQSSGKLVLRTNSALNNCLEGRVKRNLNQVIRKIITQLQGLDQVDTAPFTINNDIGDLKSIPGVGRSIFRFFSYGSGNDVVNTIVSTGPTGSPWQIGNQLSQREIAKDNLKVLDVEVVVQGHLNSNGKIFNIDQVYDVDIEDDDVKEPMYVYHCSYELTIDHGMLTRLHLCKLNTIVATSAVVKK